MAKAAWFFWAVAVLGNDWTAGLVQAQGGHLSDGGFDARLFRPAVDSRGYLSLNGADVLPDRAISFGLVLDAGFRIVPFDGYIDDDDRLAEDAHERDHLISNAITGTFLFNYGLLDWAVVGLQLPFVLMNGPNVEVPGYFNEGGGSGLSHQSVGDVVLHAKVRLLPRSVRRFGLATAVQLSFPSAQSERFGGDPGVGLWPSLVAEWHATSDFRVGLNAGYRAVFGEGAVLPIDGQTVPSAVAATDAQLVDSGRLLRFGDLLTFGLGLSYRVAPTVDLVAESYGTQLADSFGERGAVSMEAIGGLKVFVQRHSYLTLAFGGGFPRTSMQAANWRGVVGFLFEPSVNDRDGDGIRDDKDKCPDSPEDIDGFEDRDGCPDPDNDGDGIPDVDDRCPNTPEDFDGDRDDDGCPDGSTYDRDGDGIPDVDDACPDQPEDIDRFEDEDGCPDLDNDGDGIPDVDDMCPNQPEDFDGRDDEDGCPDLDNDGDRIPDVDDVCPLEPETYNGFEDEDGCPDKGLVVLEENSIMILEKVYFKTNSAEIEDRSTALLDAVAATIRGNPSIMRVEVEGHADARGSSAYNLKLTRDRAAAVVQALVDRGVSSKRLSSEGYGELCPVDPRDVPEAWERNRRVEFKVLATDMGPTQAVRGCNNAEGGVR